MSKIIRTEPNKILSKAVEYHGFVYVQGCTAKDVSKDIKGQTKEVVDQIDQILLAAEMRIHAEIVADVVAVI